MLARPRFGRNVHWVAVDAGDKLHSVYAAMPGRPPAVLFGAFDDLAACLLRSAHGAIAVQKLIFLHTQRVHTSFDQLWKRL